ncbi:hypothetical protein JXA02_02715, partial [candidate division KSB1 bacterium]|nr:hypothetical protein [candidate division KSB1 bacterium]
HELDPEYARHLKAAFQKCRQPIAGLLQNYGRYETIAGKQYPQWLIHKTGSDAAAELILGLAEFLKCEYDQQLADYTCKLAEGIIAMQIDDGSNFHGAFLSWPDLWHAWGNAQTQALTSIGLVLDRPRFIQAAQKEADHYYAYLLSDGMKNSWWYSKTDTIEEFPQIAYDIRCMTVGLLRLYEATADIKYAKMAGDAASWLVGHNAAGQVMYESKTGRCLDGINAKSEVNLNSGAESTIEALLTLVEIKHSGLELQDSNIVLF